IGGATGTQGKWISGLKLNPANTIVLTHHNGFAPDCSSVVTAFWNDMRTVLGGDPYAWYWGHVHNGIVYDAPVTIGTFKTNTLARCLGHAALPYGFSSELSGNKQIAWL